MVSGVDRISAPPEDVLQHVLHYLPAQEVVQTCVLARRWRGIWRSVPALRFTGAKGWDSADRLAQFVDHLLHLRCAGGGGGAPLDSCDFDFDSDGFMQLPANKRHASHWMWQVVPRVQVLRVRVEFGQEPSPLSDLYLVSQHLTMLELVGVRVNESVVDFSGCPALLELRMDVCHVFVNQDLKWCPTFSKLKALLLNDWCLSADHNALICFLQHSPILEKLTIQLSKIPAYVVETEGIYKPSRQSVASVCLKIVEIKCANVDKRVHKILKILTTYGVQLEQINIQHTNKISGSGCFNFVCTGFSEN